MESINLKKYTDEERKKKINDYINEYKKNRMKTDEEYKKRVLEQTAERNKNYRLKNKNKRIENIKSRLNEININDNLDEYIKLNKYLIRYNK